MFTYACHDTTRGQRKRVENRIHLGMHCVGKQCLDITIATWYNVHYTMHILFGAYFFLCHSLKCQRLSSWARKLEKRNSAFLLWYVCQICSALHWFQSFIFLFVCSRSSLMSTHIIQIWHPCGVSYLFYYTKQNTKHKRGNNYKHQRFWINTRRLPCWTSFTGRSRSKLCGCSLVFFGLEVTNQLAHSCYYGPID